MCCAVKRLSAQILLVIEINVPGGKDQTLTAAADLPASTCTCRGRSKSDTQCGRQASIRQRSDIDCYSKRGRSAIQVGMCCDHEA
jgi:hypothetical protein